MFRSVLSLPLVFVLVAFAEHDEQYIASGAIRSKWLLIEVTAGSETIIDAHYSSAIPDAPFQTIKHDHDGHEHTDDDSITLKSRNSAGEVIVHRSIGDPRTSRSEWWDDERSEFVGTSVTTPVGYVAVTVPVGAAHLLVRRHRDGARSDAPEVREHSVPRFVGRNGDARLVALAARREGVVSTERQSSPAPAPVASSNCNTVNGATWCPVLRVKQRATDPSRTLNVVFLSAGYAAGSQGTFDGDVTRAIDALKTHQPFARYVDLMNLNSVFLAADQDGINDPVGGVARSDPLKCSYGTTAATRRGVACDSALVLTLASFAPRDAAVSASKSFTSANPSASMVVVLLNSAVYGGTGGGGIATLYNGANMPGVLAHELGHALGALLDEYDFGFAAGNTRAQYPNCAATGGGVGGLPDPVPWAEMNLGAPLKTCGFQNYYRATDSCIMKSVTNEALCPVCQEQMSVQMLGALRDFASPRCPLLEETVVVAIGGRVALRVGKKFISQAGVTAVWSVNGVPQRSSSADNTSFVFGGTFTSVTGSFSVDLTITDSNPTISTARMKAGGAWLAAAVKSVSQYRVLVVANAAAMVASGCLERSSASARSRCGGDVLCTICDGNVSSCDYGGSGSVKPTTVLPMEYSTTQNMIIIALGIGVFLIVCTVLMFVQLFCCLRASMRRVANSSVPWVGALRVVQICTVVLGCLTSLAGVIYIVAVLFAYPVLSLFLLPAAVGSLVFASFAVVAGLIQFAGAHFRSRVFMIVAGTLDLLLCIAGITLAVVYTSFYFSAAGTIDDLEAATAGAVNQSQNSAMTNMSYTMPDRFVVDYLRFQWEAGVENQPDKVCNFEGSYECSGFDVSCQNGVGDADGSTVCPANCAAGNSNSQPCLIHAADAIVTNVVPFLNVTIMFSVVTFVSMVFVFILVGSIQVRKLRMTVARLGTLKPKTKEEIELGTRRLLASISKEELEHMTTEFYKISGGDNVMDRAELCEFLERVWDTKLPDEILDRLLSQLDVNQDGVVDFNEFLQLFGAVEGARTREVKLTDWEPDVATLKQERTDGLFQQSFLVEEKQEEYKKKQASTMASGAGASTTK